MDCETCNQGYTFSTAARKTTADPPNACATCSECASGKQYKVTPCTTTKDTVCSVCRACDVGKYQSTACTVSTDRQCTPCRTSCGKGAYFSYSPEKCKENVDRDVTACTNCSKPSLCTPGLYYMPDTCDGSTFQDSGCVVCTNTPCQYNQYATGCSGYQDGYCKDYPPCNAGMHPSSARLMYPTDLHTC